MDASTERCQEAQPPVPELVAEALDHDPPVGRQRAGDLELVLEIGDQVLRGQRVEVVALHERLEHVGGKVDGVPVLELSVAPPERGAHGIDDDSTRH